jgi:hemerythrin HHE cation binding domain-containing protein
VPAAAPASPTQLLLPGQAAAPDGPVDLTPMFVMHHAFRRDLDAFVAAAAATPLDDRGTWRALQRRWARFALVLHHHHSGEDSGLWPVLRARVDASALRTLDAMEADHATIDPLLAACGEGLAAVAAGAGTRAALVVRLSAARSALHRHLAAEESDAMALVQAHLTQADWEWLDREHFAPAYRPRDVVWVLPWVLHGLPASARRRMVGTAGPALLLAWRLVLRRPFERAERRAFRHARPGQ